MDMNNYFNWAENYIDDQQGDEVGYLSCRLVVAKLVKHKLIEDDEEVLLREMINKLYDCYGY